MTVEPHLEALRAGFVESMAQITAERSAVLAGRPRNARPADLGWAPPLPVADQADGARVVDGEHLYAQQVPDPDRDAQREP